MAQVSQTKAAKEELQASGKAVKALEIVPKINQKALSLDVGPKVIGILDRSLNEASKALDLEMSARGKKYEAMSFMTQGILKAALNDNTIKLSAAFSGDRKLMENLTKQLGLALGFREVVTVTDGDKSVQRVVVAKSVAKYFPSATDDPKSAEAQRKNTFRANFATAVKTCAQAAEGLILAKAKVEFDDKAGTLRISGPKVKEVFGSDSVLLNESSKQGETELTARPSFTAIRALAGEEHDAPVHRGTNTRGAQIGASAAKQVDPETALVSLCHMLIQSIGKIEGDVTAKVREALGQVTNAIGARLNGKV